MDDCHAFNMSTTLDGVETSGKMRVDSVNGVLYQDGAAWKPMVTPNSDSVMGCKFFFNDAGFNKDIEKTTPKHCCLH